jgi:hypothetical protein
MRVAVTTGKYATKPRMALKRCPKGRVLDQNTQMCVCTDGKILNPMSGRCVNMDGPTGRKVMMQMMMQMPPKGRVAVTTRKYEKKPRVAVKKIPKELLRYL